MPEEELRISFEEAQVSSHCDNSSSSSQYSVNDPELSSNDEFFDPMPIENEEEEGNANDDGVDNSFGQPIDIRNSKKKALDELRCRVEDAIINNYIYGRKNTDNLQNLSDVEIWGVPLLPSKGHEGTDIVLMKFLKAKDYRVAEAFRMLRRTMRWRRELRIDESCAEEFDNELESMWNMEGKDSEGRPICYYKIGVLKDRELKIKHLGTNEKYTSYIRWRFQCVERAVREIVFSEGASNSIIQIIDLKNYQSKTMKEVNQSINRKLMSIIHEHYPGLLHKILFINVPIWYMAVQVLNMKRMKRRAKKKYGFVRSSKVPKALLNLLPPENIPVEYGGLRRENDNEFSTNDKVIEAYAMGNWITHIKIPINEVDVTVTWDLTVDGFNVIYKEEFVPHDDCSYKVLIQKQKKMEGTVRNSFHIRESGNIIITIENATFKKRKVFYRYKSKPSIPLYLFTR